MSEYYLQIKALHIIAVVAWFAGLFYIFRLYVYHVENRDKAEVIALLEVMERRLYRAICMPGLVMTTLFGLALLHLQPYLLQQPWFHIKLGALALLFVYHFYAGKVRKDLARAEYHLTSKQCRVINEAPTVLLIVIVMMVIVRPAFGG